MTAAACQWNSQFCSIIQRWKQGVDGLVKIQMGTGVLVPPQIGLGSCLHTVIGRTVCLFHDYEPSIGKSTVRGYSIQHSEGCIH